MKNIFFKLALLIFVFSLLYVPSTSSYYYDSDNINGNSISSGCWVAPSAPTIESPFGGDVLPALPDLEWNSSENACPLGNLEYEWQVDNDEDFSSLSLSGSTNASVISLTELPNGHYYWRVRANDGYSNSSWSIVDEFIFADESSITDGDNGDNSDENQGSPEEEPSQELVINWKKYILYA